MRKRLLLISNSTLYGGGFLDHAEPEIRDFLGTIERVLFVPFALMDHDGYANKARERFARMRYQLDSLHEVSDKHQSIRNAQAVFIGGGNTFRLLHALYKFQLLALLRERVEGGMPYMGSSAGSNIAAPTIKTTNDMPIIEPPSFESLRLISFQINPHFLDPDPNSRHMGETREERLIQYLEENQTPVVGLREGAMLRIENGITLLKGSSGARVFRKGHEPVEIVPGTAIDEMVAT